MRLEDHRVLRSALDPIARAVRCDRAQRNVPSGRLTAILDHIGTGTAKREGGITGIAHIHGTGVALHVAGEDEILPEAGRSQGEGTGTGHRSGAGEASDRFAPPIIHHHSGEDEVRVGIGLATCARSAEVARSDVPFDRVIGGDRSLGLIHRSLRTGVGVRQGGD